MKTQVGQSKPLNRSVKRCWDGTVSLTEAIVTLSRALSGGTFDLLVLIGEANDTGEWARTGAHSCAAWLAELTEVEMNTARSQVRVARAMREYPELFQALEDGDMSYAKARVVVPHLTPENLTTLVGICVKTPLRDLAVALASWLNRHEDPEELKDRQEEARYVSWRTEPDGMVTITAHLPPIAAGMVCSAINQRMMTMDAPAGASMGQQRADALVDVVSAGGTGVDAEVVIHVRSDGNSMEDGTPVSDNSVAELLPEAFVSLLIHDSKRQPIDASPRRRVPTRRQKRVVDELCPTCAEPGCQSNHFLQYDHKLAYSKGGPTAVANLQKLCGPHNRAKWEKERGSNS